MKGNMLVRPLCVAAAGLALALDSGISSADAKGVITFHEGDWTGNLIQGKIAEFILTEELGYEVEYVFLPAGPPAWEAMLAGDIDIAFEFWPTYAPERHHYIAEFGGDGSIEYFGDTGLVGESGWWVPHYVIEGDAERGIEPAAPELKNWEQLNQYASTFSTPESGDKGRLVACPIAAWQVGDEIRVRNLDLQYEPVLLGSEVAQWAELESHYACGAPVLIYMWAPHWTHAKYERVRIRLPEYTDECWDYAGGGWTEDAVCDWPDDIPSNFGSPTLKGRYPAAHHVVTQFNLTNKQQTDMVYAVDVDGREVEEVVREWMAANEGIWRAWLPM